MLCCVKKGFCVQTLSEMARWCQYMATRCWTVYFFVCLSHLCCLCKWIVCTDMNVTISSASSALWTVSTGPNFCAIQKNCQLSHNGWPRTHTDTHTHRWGRRAGTLVRFCRHSIRPPLLCVFLSNVCSLKNKADELFFLIQSNQDFKDCSVFCFMETWLDPSIPDCSTSRLHTLPSG